MLSEALVSAKLAIEDPRGSTAIDGKTVRPKQSWPLRKNMSKSLSSVVMTVHAARIAWWAHEDTDTTAPSLVLHGGMPPPTTEGV